MSVAGLHLDRAVAAFRAGKLVVFPTETLYAIGCDALDAAALERLCRAKQRPAEKGIAVILGDLAMLEQLTASASEAVRVLGRAFWPGPLTILVPAREELPSPIVRDGLVGCRVSSDPTATRLARALGRPLAAPSANPADLAPARDAAAALAYFGDAVDVYLDDDVRDGAPSTLVDPGPPLRVLRSGAVSTEALEAALATRPA